MDRVGGVESGVLQAGVRLEVQGRLWRAFPWQANAPIQPDAVGFRPTTSPKSIIMGSLTPTGDGVAIFTLDLSECGLCNLACFFEFASCGLADALFRVCC